VYTVYLLETSTDLWNELMIHTNTISLLRAELKGVNILSIRDGFALVEVGVEDANLTKCSGAVVVALAMRVVPSVGAAEATPIRAKKETRREISCILYR